MIIEWSERFSLNHELLDAQHQELFELANTAQKLDPNNANKAELGRLFKEFYDYMGKHFKEEEAYMQSIDYPLYEKHKKFHESIIEGMTKILKEKKGVVELQKSIQMIAKRPEETGKAVILPAMVETYAVLALLTSIILLNSIKL